MGDVYVAEIKANARLVKFELGPGFTISRA
jgi:hypothetical protein